MNPCPSCGAHAIYEYSVILSKTAVARKGDSDPPTYHVRCRRCRKYFVRDGDCLVPVRAETWDEHDVCVWTIPPWLERSLANRFEHSWDLIEDFYADAIEREPAMAPMHELVERLREAGYARKLRAGQSLWSLVLSRSTDHGLGPEQSFLQLSPAQTERSVRVSGRIGDDDVATPPTPMDDIDALRPLLDQLCAEPVTSADGRVIAAGDPT